MKQIFISGASMTYGVGGGNGGWADKIKLKVHNLQYDSSDGFERCEVYSFARPGMEVSEVYKSLPTDISPRKHKNWDSIIILSVGVNDSRSIGGPTDYVSIPEKYEADLQKLFEEAKKFTDRILFVGYVPVDEARTAPRKSSFTDKPVYYFNHRIKEFNGICQKTCQQAGVTHLNLFDKVPGNWLDYLWKDGLHMNDKGYQWVFEQTWPIVESWINQ